MEERMFWTLINVNHRFGSSEYIIGRISGMLYAICNDDDMYIGNMWLKDGIVLRSVTTQRKYKKFTRIVEKQYPGLCTFDYMRDEK